MPNDLSAFTAKGFVRQPDGSYSKTATVATPICNPQPKSNARKKPLAPDQNESRSRERTLVRITRYATRLVDFDNGAGGCKFLIDAMRYQGLIRDDSPQDIKFEFEQVKVKTKNQEGTEIVTEEKTSIYD